MLTVAPRAGRAVVNAADQRAVVNGLAVESLLLVMAPAARLINVDVRDGGIRIVAASNRVSAVTINANRNFGISFLEFLAVRTLKIVLKGTRQSNIGIKCDADLAMTLRARFDLPRPMHWRERIAHFSDVVRPVAAFAARRACRSRFQSPCVQTLIVESDGFFVTCAARCFGG